MAFVIERNQLQWTCIITSYTQVFPVEQHIGLVNIEVGVVADYIFQNHSSIRLYNSCAHLKTKKI